MKNFVIFHKSGVGSSALIKTLQNFPNINIFGFEPFDTHRFCRAKNGRLGKDISIKDLLRVLELIYGPTGKNYLKKINSILAKYNSKDGYSFNKFGSCGFKMRSRRLKDFLILNLMRKNRVVVFFLVRRDMLRWTISLSDEHLQFFKKKRIKKVYDLDKLKRIMRKTKCYLMLIKLEFLILRILGIDTNIIYYEDFCSNKIKFFKDFLNKIENKLDDKEIIKILKMPINFKKVHSNDIKKFVLNYDELAKSFGKYI